MNQQSKPLSTVEAEENVLFGAVGAFLFALVGGILYYVLHLLGILSAFSALVGVICAIKGYSFFAKKESNRGLIISIIMAALVIIIAWYLCFCLEMVDVYDEWFANGEIDFTYKLSEYFPIGFLDLTVNPWAFYDLLWSLLFGGIACWSYVSTRKKRAAAVAAQQAAQEHTAQLAAQQAAQQAAEQAAVEQAAEAPEGNDTPETVTPNDEDNAL